MTKVVPFQHFVEFINDENFWKKWEIQISPDDGEEYFLKAYNDAHMRAISAKSFDFEKTSVTLLHVGSPCYSHDGESLFYFFNKWIKGENLEN